MLFVALTAPLARPLDVPVDPSAPEARRWLIDELARPEYQAARPSWFDLAAKAVWDWLQSLVVPSAGGWDGLALVAVAIVVAIVLAVVLIVYGVPRLNRKAVRSALFDAHDARSAREMRRAAEAAAAAGDWRLAIAERFRALAADLDARTLVSVSRGMTAQSFAVDAATPFPEFAGDLRAAAHAFDAVRYLGVEGSSERYDEVRALDEALTAAAPRVLAAAGGSAAAGPSPRNQPAPPAVPK